ncbi:guanylate kinase [Streptomyces sp. BR123]|uniref:phosphotransferase-like protein n=1 Tax=Streptomyces sp. BR123 TaxID=2749828 RepID=UPI0015C4D85C|nr:guanylate kinase [Streptomyces sp. BR123]NXY94475.1 guanylate kinase [Streptomyces sp. BR123]
MTSLPSAVILYGPPAAGKDTITQALADLEAGYAQFRRLKVGSGKTDSYRMGSAEELAALEEAGQVIYSNSRYGNVYVVDQPGLDEMVAAGLTPVLHLGQIDGVQAVIDAYPARWTTVLLWCTREETATRSAGRGDADTEARLAAWQATQEDVDAHPDQEWDLVVQTGDHSPAKVAQVISQRVRASSRAGNNS